MNGSKKRGPKPPELFAGRCVGCEIELRMIDRGELHLALSDRNHLELLAIESPAGSHANRSSGGVVRVDGLNHVAPIREGVSNDGVDAHVLKFQDSSLSMRVNTGTGVSPGPQ